MDVRVLREFVSLAVRFVPRSFILQITQHLVFLGRQLAAFDGHSWVILQTPWDCTPGFTVPGVPLAKLLATLPAAVRTVRVEHSAGSNTVYVSGEHVWAEFGARRPEEYQGEMAFPAVPAPSSFRPVSARWGPQVARVLFSVTRDASRAEFGVIIKRGWAWGIDRSRLSAAECGGPEVFLSGYMDRGLVPALPHVTGIARGPERVVLQIPHGVIVGPALNGGMPNAPDGEGMITKVRRALRDDKQRVVMSSEDPRPVARAIKHLLDATRQQCDITTRVRLTVGNNRVLIQRNMQWPDLPRSRKEEAGLEQAVPVHLAGPGANRCVSFPVNGRFFREAWERCPRVAIAAGNLIPLYFYSPERRFHHLLVRLLEPSDKGASTPR
jgi:hypothetical protein